MSNHTYKIPAIVVGLCSHGLAICRSLGRHGVPVVVLESHHDLPGLSTRYARKKFGTDINGPELIHDLIQTAQEFNDKPVLFLTNDRMVKLVADSFSEIDKYYRMNWAPPELMVTILEKKNLYPFVKAAGLTYPQSFIYTGNESLDAIISQCQFPVVIKPSTPLSPFKAFKVESRDALMECIDLYESRMPCFIIQEWVSGNQQRISMANFYFDSKHQPIASFPTRKIRAYPANTGSACSVEPYENEEIMEIGRRFFKTFPIRGPASLEIKTDDKGRHYVIEPTIGRFDFYILCSVANGLDLPMISYSYRAGYPTDGEVRKLGRRVWVDFERDFPMFIGSLKEKNGWKEGLRFILRKKVYAFFDWDDMGPFLHAWSQGIMRYTRRFGNLLWRCWGSPRL